MKQTMCIDSVHMWSNTEEAHLITEAQNRSYDKQGHLAGNASQIHPTATAVDLVCAFLTSTVMALPMQ